jgi:hypothetical protein
VEDLRLDAEAEDFPGLGRLIAGTGGEIVVPLPQDRQIRFYDSTGARIAAVGRRGQAPGEFAYLGQLGLKADTVWAMDADSRRVTYYSPRGEFLRTGPALPGKQESGGLLLARDGFLFVVAVGVHPDGSMMAVGRRSSNDPNKPMLANQMVLHLSAGGDIHALAEGPSYEDPRWMMQVAGLGRSIPFVQGPMFAFAPDASRFAFLETNLTTPLGGAYRVTLFRANGDTIFTREYPFLGVPVTQAERDSAANAEIQAPGTPSEGPGDVDQRFRRLALEKMPAVHAPLQSFLLGVDGTLWITLRDSAGVRRTVVLDESGEPMGTVVLNTRTRIRQASATRIWVTEMDENDLASVVRYRVQGLAGAGR